MAWLRDIDRWCVEAVSPFAAEGDPRAGPFISGEAGARYYLARPELGRAFRVAVLYRF